MPLSRRTPTSGARCSGWMLTMKRLGASGGSLARQVASRSLAGEGQQQHRGQAQAQRDDLHGVGARAAAQVREAVAPGTTARPRRDAPEQRAARRKATPPNTASAAAKPPNTVSPELRFAGLPDEQRRDARQHRPRRRRARPARGGPTSRRITRIAGTFFSCSSGGSAKPSSSASPISESLQRRQQRRLRQRRPRPGRPEQRRSPTAPT